MTLNVNVCACVITFCTSSNHTLSCIPEYTISNIIYGIITPPCSVIAVPVIRYMPPSRQSSWCAPINSHSRVSLSEAVTTQLLAECKPPQMKTSALNNPSNFSLKKVSDAPPGQTPARAPSTRKWLLCYSDTSLLCTFACKTTCFNASMSICQGAICLPMVIVMSCPSAGQYCQ